MSRRIGSRCPAAGLLANPIASPLFLSSGMLFLLSGLCALLSHLTA